MGDEVETSESNDSSQGKEYVDATQFIDDESDFIEVSHPNNSNKNKKFLQKFWDVLEYNLSEEVRDMIDQDDSPLESPSFTLVRGKHTKKAKFS